MTTVTNADREAAARAGLELSRLHERDPAAILAEHTRLTNLIPPDRKIATRGTVGDSDGDDGA